MAETPSTPTYWLIPLSRTRKLPMPHAARATFDQGGVQDQPLGRGARDHAKGTSELINRSSRRSTRFIADWDLASGEPQYFQAFIPLAHSPSVATSFHAGVLVECLIYVPLR